jgi:hypothetical protein
MMPDIAAAIRTISEDQGSSTPQTATGHVRLADLLKDHFDQSDTHGINGSDGREETKQTKWSETSSFRETIEADSLPEDLPTRLIATEPYIVSFSPLQEWEGYVVTVTEKNFTARLTDITKGALIEEDEVELPLDDLTEVERQALKRGSIFRWVIGYQITRTGQRKRASQIVFRQLPRWTKRELDEATRQGQERVERIKWK